MNNIEKIVNSIKSVFDFGEEKTSSLVSMLSHIEGNHLRDHFGQMDTLNIYTKEELYSKVNLLNALLELVLENPNMENMEEKVRRELLKDLYKVTASLYEQILRQTNEDELWNNLSCLVMYSMMSYLADQQTLSDLVINEYNEKLEFNISLYENASIIQRLEYDTYYLIILMLSNICNYDGLMLLNNCIERANATLNQAQEDELQKVEMSVVNGYRIAAFGNLIYLTSVLKDYLFKGKIDSDQNQDIRGLIDTYSYNAYFLLQSDSIELKIIGHLIKYSYEKIAENSIWNIAEKSPLIRKFIESNLGGENRYIYSLLPSQRDVISEVLTPKKSIVVGMPTSSGKSFLAEMQILFCIHNYRTKEFKPTVCYIVPTNALIAQVKRDLKNDFKAFEFNIETVLPYYEVDEIEDEILNRQHVDILISTPEKLEALIRSEHPAVANTRLVVLDEAHNLGDESRGSKFELVLATVKHKIREANFLLLSPFISNAKEIGEWLDDSKKNTVALSVEWTPTKQYIGCNVLNTNKTKSYLCFYKTARNQLGTEDVEILLRNNPHDVKNDLGLERVDNRVRLCTILDDFLEQEGNILVLCGGPVSTKSLAFYSKKYFVKKQMLTDISNDPEIKTALDIIHLEHGIDDDLYELVKYGICYHNSGLSSLVKETIEELIRNNKIKLIFATTTLAQGMNFPISTVIFDVTYFKGPNGGREFSNAEFWNIAGRAGRAYKDKEGYVIVSFSRSQKKTKEIVRKYIEADLKKVISSLNVFFAGENRISLDYDVLKDSKNAPLLNLLQYINHILNVSYDYNIDAKDVAKIRGILNDSYLYHSLSREDGFVKAQVKLNAFVTQYIKHVNAQKKEDVSKADELGISDVSYTKIKSMIGAFINQLKEQGDNQYKVSEIILKTQNTERLARIIELIARIPEIKLEIFQRGSLDSESIAKLVLGWVNGDSVKDIAEAIRREDQSIDSAMSICNQYLNSQMKSYMPWGINIYQSISYDLKTENAQMLPSYIYYGVSDKESVIISKLGVPRFAVKNVLQVLKRDFSDLPIQVRNLEQLRKVVKEIRPEQYHLQQMEGEAVKRIVDRKLEG